MECLAYCLMANRGDLTAAAPAKSTLVRGIGEPNRQYTRLLNFLLFKTQPVIRSMPSTNALLPRGRRCA